MAYIIRKTDGSTLGTILDGTVDTSKTSLTLIGRNYSNYGQLMTDNLVALLENFAYSIAPSNPLAGQLWWDTSNNLLKVYTGSVFKIISSATAAPSAPTTTIAGDIWWDTDDEQLYVYNGTTPYNVAGWILVGPAYSKINGKSGAIWEIIYDTLGAPHHVLTIYLDGDRTGIVSTDATFTAAGVAGFTTINQGYNMYASGIFSGTANNASYLGNQPAANFWRNNQNNSGTGTLAILNNSGITVGVDNELKLSVDSNIAEIRNQNLNNGIEFYVNASGTDTLALAIDGTGSVLLSEDPALDLGAATKQYVDGKFNNTVLTGVPVAPTAPEATSNNMLATTEFVTSGLSGLQKNKIYQGNSYVEVIDTGTGSVTTVVDGVVVATASSAGFNLFAGATAVTQPDTYNGTGNARVATTQFVKNATQWWGGSAKFVSADAPQAGVNDAGSRNGDFWFQYSTTSGTGTV